MAGILDNIFGWGSKKPEDEKISTHQGDQKTRASEREKESASYSLGNMGTLFDKAKKAAESTDAPQKANPVSSPMTPWSKK